MVCRCSRRVRLVQERAEEHDHEQVDGAQRGCVVERQPSNFTRSLPATGSELAQQTAKDPYAFKFLGLSGEVPERDFEQARMDRIVDALRELASRIRVRQATGALRS